MSGQYLDPRGKLKVPRPVSEKQKAEAVEEFKKNFHL
jgi:hypothetical protein